MDHTTAVDIAKGAPPAAVVITKMLGVIDWNAMSVFLSSVWFALLIAHFCWTKFLRDWWAHRFYRRAKRKIARANRQRGAVNPRLLAGVAAASLALAGVLVKGFEVRDRDHPNLLSYQDSGGVWTNGYGHTHGVKRGQVITKEQADAWLAEDLKIAAAVVDSCINGPMDASKRAALISFAFNVGPGAAGAKDGLCMLKNGRQPIVRRAANAGDWPRACNALLEWTTAGGVELRGLVKRRKAERDLCMRADFGNVESGANTNA